MSYRCIWFSSCTQLVTKQAIRHESVHWRWNLMSTSFVYCYYLCYAYCFAWCMLSMYFIGFIYLFSWFYWFYWGWGLRTKVTAHVNDLGENPRPSARSIFTFLVFSQQFTSLIHLFDSIWHWIHIVINDSLWYRLSNILNCSFQLHYTLTFMFLNTLFEYMSYCLNYRQIRTLKKQSCNSNLTNWGQHM